MFGQFIYHDLGQRRNHIKIVNEVQKFLYLNIPFVLHSNILTNPTFCLMSIYWHTAPMTNKGVGQQDVPLFRHPICPTLRLPFHSQSVICHIKNEDKNSQQLNVWA